MKTTKFLFLLAVLLILLAANSGPASAGPIRFNTNTPDFGTAVATATPCPGPNCFNTAQPPTATPCTGTFCFNTAEPVVRDGFGTAAPSATPSFGTAVASETPDFGTQEAFYIAQVATDTPSGQPGTITIIDDGTKDSIVQAVLSFAWATLAGLLGVITGVIVLVIPRIANMLPPEFAGVAVAAQIGAIDKSITLQQKLRERALETPDTADEEAIDREIARLQKLKAELPKA